MKKLLTTLAISAVLLSGCTLMQNNEAIIKVNDQTITQADFDQALDKNVNNSFFKNFGGSKNFVKSSENPMFIIFKEKTINELIVKSLLDSEIEKRNIKAEEKDIQEELKSVIDRVGSKDEFNNILKQRGISNNQFMEDLKTQIKIKKLVQSIEKIKISDADAKKYYDNNKKEFTHKEEVRASHILVSANTLELIKEFKSQNHDITPEDLNKKIDERIAKQQAKAETILKEVKQDPDSFAKIAQKKSDDKASGERGGELGYFGKEEMVPEFSNVAFSMRPNTVHDTVVRSPYGFHIIKVTDRVEPGLTPYKKVEEEIKFFLETQKEISVLKDLTNSLMKTAKIEYIDNTYDPKYIAEEAAKTAKLQKEIQEEYNNEKAK